MERASIPPSAISHFQRITSIIHQLSAIISLIYEDLLLTVTMLGRLTSVITKELMVRMNQVVFTPQYGVHFALTRTEGSLCTFTAAHIICNSTTRRTGGLGC